MKIAVEFDGTIVENSYPDIGKELPFAAFILICLIKHGHKLILYTHRTGQELEAALRWCTEQGIEFWAINKSSPEETIHNNNLRKIDADLFIDGDNLGGIPQWTKIFSMLHPKDADPIRLRLKYGRHKINKTIKSFI